MKGRFLFVTLFVIILLLFSSIAVFAEEEFTVSVICDSITRSIIISGNIGDVRDNNVYLTVAPVTMNVIDKEAIENYDAIITVAEADIGGNFSKTIIFDKMFSNGEYRLIAICGGKTAETQFIYINPDSIQSLLQEIGKNPTQEDVDKVLRSNLDKLVLDPTLYENAKSLICSIIASQCPSEGYTVPIFFTTLNGALAAYEIKNGQMSVDKIFEKYLAGIIDYEKDYNSLKEDVKTALWARMKNADYTKEDFKTTFERNRLIVELLCAKDFIEFREILFANRVLASIDFTEYEKKSPYLQDVIMQTAFAARKRIDRITDIKEIFDNAVKSVNDRSTSNVSGGSTRGGGLSSKVSFEQDYEEGKSSDTYEKERFIDLENHWANEIINSLYELKIISGYEDGSFRPDQEVLRCEFAKMIAELFSLPDGELVEFRDVSQEDWFAPYVSRCSYSGIVLGSDRYFRPYDVITREEAAVIVYRALLNQKNQVNQVNERGNFIDDDHIAEYAVEPVGVLAGIKIINGYNNFFYPKNSLTRAEAATITYNTLKYIEK